MELTFRELPHSIYPDSEPDNVLHLGRYLEIENETIKIGDSVRGISY